MKKLIIFACSLMAGVSVSAQDVLITQKGDVKNVYDVEVGPSTVFYKEEDKADAPTLRIKKADVIMIKERTVRSMTWETILCKVLSPLQ
ncbi:hypothetical protein [Prevotella sp.]|uniref:hypothetical protein n=1 Tax=Prevotella sp. TaxID=59823 RepID=UPI003080D185